MIPIVILLLLLLSCDAARASGNLLVNSDAETGDITGWTAGSPQFRAITPAQGFPVYEGNWSFSAGPAGGTSVMWQDVDLTTYASCIDRGSCSFNLMGWSRTDDSDSARVYAFFSGATSGASFDTGYSSSPTGWSRFVVSGVLPTGIRTASIYLYGKGPFNVWINVYFDLLSLTITPTNQPTWGMLKANYR